MSDPSISPQEGVVVVTVDAFEWVDPFDLVVVLFVVAVVTVVVVEVILLVVPFAVRVVDVWMHVVLFRAKKQYTYH